MAHLEALGEAVVALLLLGEVRRRLDGVALLVLGSEAAAATASTARWQRTLSTDATRLGGMELRARARRVMTRLGASRSATSAGACGARSQGRSNPRDRKALAQVAMQVATKRLGCARACLTKAGQATTITCERAQTRARVSPRACAAQTAQAQRARTLGARRRR